MVTLDEAVIARLSTKGERFEVLVHPELALRVKQGEKVELEQLVAVEQVFRDARKGEKASVEHAMKVLGAGSLEEVIYRIVRKGEIQLTTEQRRKMQEQRRRQVISYIAKHAINPQTGTPHPPQRIEKALEEAKVNIDIHRSAEAQVPEVVKAIRRILPLKFEERTMAVKVPWRYVSKAQHVVKMYGKPEREEWLRDGSWVFAITLPAGAMEEMLGKLEAATRGEVEVRRLE